MNRHRRHPSACLKGANSGSELSPCNRRYGHNRQRKPLGGERRLIPAFRQAETLQPVLPHRHLVERAVYPGCLKSAASDPSSSPVNKSLLLRQPFRTWLGTPSRFWMMARRFRGSAEQVTMPIYKARRGAQNRAESSLEVEVQPFTREERVASIRLIAATVLGLLLAYAIPYTIAGAMIVATVYVCLTQGGC